MARWGFSRNTGGAADTVPLGLYSPDQFHRILLRERDLANRFEGCFSLLVFAARDPKSLTATLTQLVQDLRCRLRCSDEVGWLDERHTQVGVVMHRILPEDAWKVADDVVAAFPAGIPPPLCSVRHYPSDPSLGHDVRENAAGRLPGPAKPVDPVEALFTRGMPAWKRCIDIIGAATGLALLAPLFLLIAVTIKATSRGPVFYSQDRRGWSGRRFVIHKFRSMSTDAEEKHRWLMMFNEQDGAAFKMKNDPRITAVGRFLRKTSLDELPQLWNVLNGDMSLVGPRPLVCPEADAVAVWQRQRLDVTPGMTGIWQVRGSRDDFDGWMRMDLQYIESRTLMLDLRLLLETIRVVFFGRPSGF